MWKSDERDGVILVRESRSSPVWNVHLQPIQEMLAVIHTEFFRQVDHHQSALGKGDENSLISPVACYKEILRRELSIRIADNICGAPQETTSGPPPAPQVAKKLVDSNGIPFSL
jgi:hypothetical protein